MQLWVGLGNPGTQYALNRHNVGFMAVDTIADVWRFSPAQKKFQGWLLDGRIGGSGGVLSPARSPLSATRHPLAGENGDRIIILKPATFMNESGRSVAEALRFYKLDVDALTVFHDELDLAPMKVKVKRGGGTAGHNGLRSIDAHLGKEFRRVRIGIGHPGHKDRVTGHVLGNYAKSDIDPLAAMLGAIAAEAEWLAKGDDTRFMNDVAMRLG